MVDHRVACQGYGEAIALRVIDHHALPSLALLANQCSYGHYGFLVFLPFLRDTGRGRGSPHPFLPVSLRRAS